MRYKGFRPAKGVTLENSLRHVAAIEEAAVRDSKNVEPQQRAAALRLLRAALQSAIRTIDRLLGEKRIEEDDSAQIYTMIHPKGGVN